jgi:hypothetical protein
MSANPRTWVAILGAACLAAATFFTQRLLGAEHVGAWVRARTISEALKREAYKFAAGVTPYNAAGSVTDAALEKARQQIEELGDDLMGELVPAKGTGSAPRSSLTKDEYIEQRVKPQITWYRRRAEEYRKTSHWLRRLEFVLALGATLVTAAASVTPKANLLFGVQFDIAALTAVLTTVAGAVLTHIERSRLDFLVIAYLAAARQLEDRENGPKDPWSDFVTDCERILETENNSWIAKWTK